MCLPDAGGVLVAPRGYHARMQQVCRDHDILYIADEVVTGFGRVLAVGPLQLLGIALQRLRPVKWLGDVDDVAMRHVRRILILGHDLGRFLFADAQNRPRHRV